MNLLSRWNFLNRFLLLFILRVWMRWLEGG